MRDHHTTTSGWQMIEKLDMVGCKVKMDLATFIEGCPYEINLEVVFTEKELCAMGFGNDNGFLCNIEHIAYSFGQTVPEKVMAVQSLMWDYIKQVNKVMDDNDITAWTVENWDAHCPFLFECDPGLESEEQLQEERDTWT